MEKQLTCFCCGSKRHLVEDWPHKECVNNEGQGDIWRGEDDGDWNQQEGEYGYDNWNQWRGENEGGWNQQEGK